MFVYKVMAKNQRNDIQYTDSYWLKNEDAIAHVEHMKLSDEQEDEPQDDWHYWIVRVHVR